MTSTPIVRHGHVSWPTQVSRALRRAEEKEAAAGNEAEAALREALFGNAAEARRRAAARGHSMDRDVKYGATLALVFAGDTTRAQILADDLSRRFPEDTVVQFNYLPTIRAKLALSCNSASKVVESLQFSGGRIAPRLLPPTALRSIGVVTCPTVFAGGFPPWRTTSRRRVWRRHIR